ncbi:MAG: hypothetical protein F6K58_23310 [Symploca sp. SIO2E9]|nr:hypothetical protein [Symploca sp. SIO2E9]
MGGWGDGETPRWRDGETIFMNFLPPASCLLPPAFYGRWGEDSLGHISK